MYSTTLFILENNLVCTQLVNKRIKLQCIMEVWFTVVFPSTSQLQQIHEIHWMEYCACMSIVPSHPYPILPFISSWSHSFFKNLCSTVFVCFVLFLNLFLLLSFFFFFLEILGFKLSLALARQALYHLSHASSPEPLLIVPSVMVLSLKKK
jgi:hypothetical protein